MLTHTLTITHRHKIKENTHTIIEKKKTNYESKRNKMSYRLSTSSLVTPCVCWSICTKSVYPESLNDSFSNTSILLSYSKKSKCIRLELSLIFFHIFDTLKTNAIKFYYKHIFIYSSNLILDIFNSKSFFNTFTSTQQILLRAELVIHQRRIKIL